MIDEIGVDGSKNAGGEQAGEERLRYGDGTRGRRRTRYPVLYAGCVSRADAR